MGPDLRAFASRATVRDPVAGRGSRVDETPDPVPPRRLQDREGPVDIAAEVCLRIPDRGDDIGARRQMEDPVDPFEESLNPSRLGDSDAVKTQPAEAARRGDVLQTTRGEVIEDRDLMAVFYEFSVRWLPMKPAPPVTSVFIGPLRETDFFILALFSTVRQC